MTCISQIARQNLTTPSASLGHHRIWDQLEPNQAIVEGSNQAQDPETVRQGARRLLLRLAVPRDGCFSINHDFGGFLTGNPWSLDSASADEATDLRVFQSLIRT